MPTEMNLHKLTTMSAAKRGCALVAVVLADDDLAPLAQLLERQARVFDIGGLPEQRDLLSRVLGAVRAAL